MAISGYVAATIIEHPFLTRFHMQRLLAGALTVILMYSLEANGQSERGQLKDGKPVGVWEYYDFGVLGLRYDYDSGRIQEIQPDSALYLTAIDTTWQAKRLERAPRVLGSRSEVLVAIQRKLRYPVQDLRNKVSGTVILTYVVDRNGVKTNPVAVTTPSVTIAEEVYRAIESVPFNYLPAIYQGKTTPVKVAFVVRFAICSSLKECQEATVMQARQFPKPTGFFGEIMVTAH